MQKNGFVHLPAAAWMCSCCTLMNDVDESGYLRPITCLAVDKRVLPMHARNSSLVIPRRPEICSITSSLFKPSSMPLMASPFSLERILPMWIKYSIVCLSVGLAKPQVTRWMHQTRCSKNSLGSLTHPSGAIDHVLVIHVCELCYELRVLFHWHESDRFWPFVVARLNRRIVWDFSFQCGGHWV